MTLHLKNALNRYVEGNRSKNYIGVALMFHPEFFWETSHRRTLYGRDPRLKRCRRNDHGTIRDKLEEHGRNLEFRKAEMLSEWMALINEGTKICTNAFTLYSGLQKMDEVHKTEANDQALARSFEVAIYWLNNEVEDRESSHAWFVNRAASITVNSRQMMVHAVRQEFHSLETRGRVVYKIASLPMDESRALPHALDRTMLRNVHIFHETGRVSAAALKHSFEHRRVAGEDVYILSLDQEQMLRKPTLLIKDLLQSS